MFVASGFLFGCWTMRALGSTFLLSALGVGFSPTLALVVMCLAAAASILPITAGGAVVSIGATSGVLLGLGVPKDAAVNFSLASGMLLTGAALVGRGGRCRRVAAVHLQRRRFARATIARRAPGPGARSRVLGATLDLPGTRSPARRDAAETDESSSPAPPAPSCGRAARRHGPPWSS